ncbi:MAG TPA: methionyl-tRNA formyltransferase [Verrucomicrobiae bacterium]|nr:methionyl-tRNA formyltransferase [Verrucomicrobiae bacterium]
MPPLRIVFMGTAALACPALAALTRTPTFQVSGVVTQPDRPKGRDLRPHPSPVKLLGASLHLPVLQPERARDESFIQELRQLAPDLIVVVAYGQILPGAILELPRHGCLNIHASLLPKYRGAAPIQWAILNDESETGVTIMKMDEGLDTGGILGAETTAIGPEDNSQTVHDRLAAIGAELLLKTIPEYASGRITPRPQPATGATYARKITREDGRLDWNQPSRALWNRVRAFVPWPGAFTFFPISPRVTLLKVWRAEPIEAPAARTGEVLDAGKNGIVVGCGQGALRILSLQREGGKQLNAAEFLTGHPLKAGDRLE